MIKITFPKLNHFWLDSGLLGLEVMLREVDSNIEKKVSEQGLTLEGSEDSIKDALEKAYDLLIKRYYDLSTKKQKEDLSSYNFYYSSKKDEFCPFPKKKSVGIAELIYNKAPRPYISSIKWEKKVKKDILINGKTKKVNRGILPNSHNHLQKRLDEFLDKKGLDVTTSGLLIDGPNIVQPKIDITIKSGIKKGFCYLCGEDSHALTDANQTVFPFITGSSGVLSFNTFGGNPEKVCWKCELIGKFSPVNGFYLSQRDNLFAFFPYSVSFEKMLEVYDPLKDAKYDDPNLFKNFNHPFGFKNYEDGFFQKPFEVAFAFFYTLYKKVLLYQKNNEDKEILDWEKMLNLTHSKASLEFIVLHAEYKGQTYMGKMVWHFRDSFYFFRLMKKLNENNVKIKEVMGKLIDFTQKKNENKTLIRNRVCERILKKYKTIDLIESHVFSSNQTYIKPLLDFVINYEPIIIKEVNSMTIEEQKVAVSVGRRVGMAVANNKGKKGNLYSLRKSRKKSDFLNELNRFQFKYDLIVPKELYEGKLTDSNFVEFKYFCMIAALNSLLAGSKS